MNASPSLTGMRRPVHIARVTKLLRVALGVAVTCVVVALGVSAPVAAHTDFVGSDPANGEVVDGPVARIVLEFTGESTEAGEGFVVLDAAGELRRPTSVTSADAKTFLLNFDPALTGGPIGVRWSVRAGDSHPIGGSFSFTAGDPVAAPDAGSDSAGAAATAETRDAASSLSTAGDDDDLAAFLDVDDSRPGETTAGLGRTVTLLATVFVLGALAVAFTTLRGPAGEIGWLLRAVRVAGGVLAIGAVVEYVGVARVAGDAMSAAWSSSAGAAAVLRIAAGIGIAVGIAATTVDARRPAARSLSAAVDSATRSTTATGFDAGSDQRPSAGVLARWVPDRRSALGLGGAVVLVVSFWFDGHTVSEGFRPLHAVTNSVHVVAGSIWAGGVITMAVVMWRRRLQHRRSGALDLVVRFSAVASVALGAVVAAGLVMAALIADSFADVTGTEWGRTLLLKTAAAGIVMAFGAWNHFRLLPELEARPDDAGLQHTARATVTAEAIVLAFVVVTTASLVAAAI